MVRFFIINLMVRILIGAISKTFFYNENLLPHTIFNMSCDGSEATIFDCPYSTKVPVNSECNSYEDASVICQGTCIMIINITTLIFS